MKDFKDIKFPHPPIIDKNGEMVPFVFYGKVIPCSRKIRFKLGYFSSNTIAIIAAGFARFIYNKGIVEFVINQFLNEKDYDLLSNNQELEEFEFNLIESICKSDLKELHNLFKEANDHFFNCLKFLLNNGQINIIPVICADGAMSHYKEAIFTDEAGNKIYINGSCNFTATGILENGESFIVHQSWRNNDDKELIEHEERSFEKIFSRKATDEFIYLDKSKLEKIIHLKGKDKSLTELLYDEKKLHQMFLNRKNIIEEQRQQELELIDEMNEIINTPRFPFDSLKSFQKLAYDRWVSNGFKGLFAMATGTGKTVTALNCILEEWRKDKTYRVIILVPTKALASQWRNEASKFNFTNTITTGEDKLWKDEINNVIGCIKIGLVCNFILITTYALFKRKNFQDLLKKFGPSLNTITLIADEAHTLGSPGGIKSLPFIIEKRIGLSATPDRKYDSIGSKSLTDFFKAEAPHYTINYTMKRAIDDEILCPYEYFPRFCSLTNNERLKYLEITKKLTRYMDSKTGKYKDIPEANFLLILRKHIIHKAQEKITLFDKIISSDIGVPNVKYLFVYVPEGFEPDYWESDQIDDSFDEENQRLIKCFSLCLGQKGIAQIQFTGNTPDKDYILHLFSIGKYKALIAMKCLDEGIDIPRAEYAIFCSSTGNPRQFIQRRGRVLRKHAEKDKAKIYDIIIKPDFKKFSEFTTNQIQTEKNIFKSELLRVINFAAIAENRMQIVQGELELICKDVGIDNLTELMNIEFNNQNIDL